MAVSETKGSCFEVLEGAFAVFMVESMCGVSMMKWLMVFHVLEI